jgi:CRISPR/Cas system-associated exonuclease Cas4 (RecB family)
MTRSIIGTLKFQRPLEGDFDHVAFGQEIEEAYLKQRRAGGVTKKKTFSPSTIGYGHGNCARYWYIAFDGAEFKETTDAQGLANMQNGTAAHDRIQKVLEGTGRLKDVEIEVTYDDPPIRGFVDAVLEWEGNPVIAEIKTAKQEVYAIRQSSMKPSPNHLLQLLIYMKILKAAQGVFIYENKNDQELTLIPIKVSERYVTIIEELFDWLRKVKKSHEDQELPTRPFTKSKPACKGCPVFDVCWKELPNGENAIPEYVPAK